MGRGDGKVVKVHNAINTRVISALTRNKATVFSCGPVEIFTKVNTKKMKEMDMEK